MHWTWIAVGLVAACGGRGRSSPLRDGGPDAPRDVTTEGRSDGDADVAVCVGQQVRCAGTCVELSRDFGNCGSCGHVCAVGEVCEAGACQVRDCREEACPLRSYCNLSNGHCIVGCLEDAHCAMNSACDTADRTCVCAPGYHGCGDTCLSDTSPDSCGAACTPCPTISMGEALCNAGVCGGECPAGLFLVDGRCTALVATVEPITGAGTYGLPISLVFDGAGVAHVAFYDENRIAARHGKRGVSGWTFEDVGSAATDTSGSIHILFDGRELEMTFFDTTLGLFTHARQVEEGRWTLNPLGYYALYHGSVEDGSDALQVIAGNEYLLETASGWHRERTRADSASYSVLAVDGSNVPHYVGRAYDPGRAQYMVVYLHRVSEGNWVEEVVERAITYQTSFGVQVDSHQGIHAVFIRGDSRELMYAYRASDVGGWAIEQIADCRGYVALFVDHLDQVHVAFRNDTDGLSYGRRDAGGSWGFLSIDTNGNHPSLVVRPDGTAHVAYQTYRDGQQFVYAVIRGAEG